MDDVVNEKKQDATFRTRVAVYAKPTWKILIGIFMVVLVGVVAPLFGWFIMKAMALMNLAVFMNTSALDEVLPWCGWMLLSCLVILIAKSISGVLLTHVSQEIIQGFRAELYEKILRKDIGWHDQRDNGAGIMTATLASDVQLLNGVSSEGMAVMVEAFAAVICGFVASIIFSWPIALIGVGVLPFILICGIIVAKADNESMMNIKQAEGSDEKSDDSKMSAILASDSITNYKTVASFGHEELLLNEFNAINMRKAHVDRKAAYWYALALGVSTGVQNLVFAIFYFSTGELLYAYPDTKALSYENMYIAMFIFIFGAFTAAQSTSMGPDMNKAKKAAIKVFTIMDTPSKIDVLAEANKNSKPIPETF